MAEKVNNSTDKKVLNKSDITILTGGNILLDILKVGAIPIYLTGNKSLGEVMFIGSLLTDCTMMLTQNCFYENGYNMNELGKYIKLKFSIFPYNQYKIFSKIYSNIIEAPFIASGMCIHALNKYAEKRNNHILKETTDIFISNKE